MTTPSQPIGLIGVGLLGFALAKRLLGKGHRVIGFDISPERLSELEERGGQPAKSASAVAAECRRIVLCLPDGDVVTEVVEQIEGELGSDTVILDTTTTEPRVSVDLAARLNQSGVAFLDATVAGSSDHAARGECMMMVGGDATRLEQCESLLTDLCKQYFHVGPSGSGARMKLVVNLVLGLNRAALAEGLALAKSCGMDLDLTLQVLKASPAYSAAMTTKGRKMVDCDFAPQARLAQHLKDVDLILRMAREVGAATPLEATHEHLLRRAVSQGFGEADNSAIVKAYNF